MLFNHNTEIIKSYAKINLSLKIVNTREDGYHELEMVTVPLELHDVVEIYRDPSLMDTYITCDDVGLAHLHNNLCTKAVEAMRKEYGFKDNFNINIHKEIPFAAGLGGGSSNAAAVITSIVRILKLKTDPETINKVALSIGADVPFFIQGKPSFVSGLGEKLQQIPVKSTYYCLIVKPEQGLSTKEVYQASDSYKKENINTEDVLDALKTDNFDKLGTSIGNDLYLPATKMLPEVKTIVDQLKNSGFAVAAMTGSGSACFGLSKNAHFVKESAKRFKKLGYVVRITKTLN